MTTRKNFSEYIIWKSMRRRCSNPRAGYFDSYGGRGISICAAWDDFRIFLADMGFRPGVGYSLDRIDNDGDYHPRNCRWASLSQQAFNRRVRSDNTTGTAGVRRHSGGGFVAYLGDVYLGYFRDKTAAVSARKTAEKGLPR